MVRSRNICQCSETNLLDYLPKLHRVEGSCAFQALVERLGRYLTADHRESSALLKIETSEYHIQHRFPFWLDARFLTRYSSHLKSQCVFYIGGNTLFSLISCQHHLIKNKNLFLF